LAFRGRTIFVRVFLMMACRACGALAELLATGVTQVTKDVTVRSCPLTLDSVIFPVVGVPVPGLAWFASSFTPVTAALT
jgi:hypothetical protein